MKRCAIYTRKSTEEGLEQSFNTLHAQREACEAYVKSQAGEGWAAISALYDDGGFSGGSMERPALKALLRDIEQGRVDVVVVYKVDRLTRSLADFARIVDAFDRRSVSFVSVTQAFNTTTSMGRLTLNVLLSFAQFEREVTGERIRDKIAASKKKGLWMGGVVPLGYSAKDKKLVIEPAEAATVEMIFQRYLALGSVQKLRVELDTMQIRSKAWTTRAGNAVGGCPFSCGSLYKLLSNRHYTGAIVHKDIAYPNHHAPIVEPELFDAVQASLALKAVRARGSRRPSERAPLKGLVFSGGKPMTPSFGCDRRKTRYRYYILSGAQGAPSESDPPRRIPAGPFEALVTRQLQRFSEVGPISALSAAERLRRIDLRASSLELVCNTAAMQPALHPELALDEIRRRLFDGEKAVVEDDDPTLIRISLPIRAQFRGGRTWIEGDVRPMRIKFPGKPKPQIAAALRRAHVIVRGLGGSPLRGPMLVSASPVSSYEARLAHLTFLSPELQIDLLHGRHSEHLTLDALLAQPPPLLWTTQRDWLANL